MRLPGLPTSSPRTLLELDLTRGLVEGPPGTPLQALRSRGLPVLRDVVEGLRRAAADDAVVGLVAHVGGGALSLAQAEEVRRAVQAFAAAGKPTTAWAESFGEVGPGNVDYYLATGFDQVWLQPVGDVGLVGVAAQAVFLKEALAKLGVQPQIAQRHEYKTAANTFTQDGFTDAHREMATRLAESATETIVAGVAAGRGLSEEEVRDLIDLAPINAAEALEVGLVDHLGYRADVYAAVRAAAGVPAAGASGDAGDGLALRYVERYGKGPLAGVPALLGKLRGDEGPALAVVHAAGPIQLGRSGGSPLASSGAIGSDSLCAALRAAGRDEDVKAVVLRVDSPGGSYVASDAIRAEVKALRAAGTPVVASMGSIAGSGGYYIAMGADRVLASAGTITGSIGVVAGKQVLGEALDRIGVSIETVTTGRYADMLSTQRPFTEDEWERLDAWMDRAYDDFTAKAAEDRGMDVEQLRSLARGRVWTGADAVANGLVDAVGGLEEAIADACDLAGVDRSRVSLRTMPKPGFVERLLPAENSESPVAAGLGGGLTVGGVAGGLLDLVSPGLAAQLRPQVGALTMPITWHLR